MFCTLNQPRAWIQQLISARIDGQPKNQSQINHSYLIAGWINSVVESNKPAADFCLNQLSTRNQLEINRFSLIAAWINCLVESTRTAVDFRLNQWSTRNQRFWLIQPHWINSPDFSDVFGVRDTTPSWCVMRECGLEPLQWRMLLVICRMALYTEVTYFNAGSWIFLICA
jgi:hypothetical protein